MQYLTTIVVRHAPLVHLVTLGLALLLAACNQGNDGGGGPAY